MTYLMQFGGYVFPPGFAPISHDATRDVAEQERPRAAGAVTQSGRLQSRRLTVEGSAMGFGGGPIAIQAAMDAIQGACGSSGAVQKLFFGRSDRYINAQVTGLSESYKQGESSAYGVNHRLMISFLAGDPYFYDIAGPVSAVGLTSAGGIVTPGGNAPALATWSIGISTGGTGQITLTNTTTGEIATLGTPATVWANGDAVVLTRATGVYTVTRNGAPAPGLMLGLIPALAAGPNVVSLSATGGMALGALGCSATARWLG